MTGLNHNTVYWWNITVTDGNGDWGYDNYTFTTGMGGGSNPDVPDTPDPTNHEPNVPINLGLFSVHVSDPDGDNLNTTFYWENNTVIGYDDSTASGGTASITPTLSLSYGTTYYWYVVVNDSSLTRRGPGSGYWDFTTTATALSITKEWNVCTNNSIQVWLNVTNTGQANMTDVLVQETYDAYVEFNHSTPTNDTGFDNKWTIPYLNISGYENDWYNITIWLNLTGLPTNGEEITNEANATFLTDTESATPSADLTVGFTVTKEANATYWTQGQNYTYFINITNTGDFTLHNIWVNETYDSDCTYVSNSTNPAYDASNSNNSWKWNSLAPGATIAIEVVVNATGVNLSTVHNVVDVETDEGPTGQATLDTYIGAKTSQLRVTYNTPLGNLLSSAYGALLLVVVLAIVLAAVAIMFVLVKMRRTGGVV